MRRAFFFVLALAPVRRRLKQNLGNRGGIVRPFRMIALAVVLAVGVPALAQSSSNDWEFGVAPYLWGAGVDGDVKIGRLPATGVEASFSDLLDVLDIGGMLAFEGRKGTWGFIFDGIYLKLED